MRGGFPSQLSVTVISSRSLIACREKRRNLTIVQLQFQTVIDLSHSLHHRSDKMQDASALKIPKVCPSPGREVTFKIPLKLSPL